MKARIRIAHLLAGIYLFSVFAVSAAAGEPSKNFTLIKQHFKESFWNLPGRNNEQLAVPHLSSLQAAQWAGSLRPDGSWSDINYADQTRDFWQTAEHLKRVQAMAIVFARDKAAGKSDAGLKRAILTATDYWTANDFQNPNWWHNQIGVPNDLSDIMLLMEDEMSPSEKDAGLQILKRIEMKGTAQNLAWEAGIVFKTALLMDDLTLADKARDTILSQVVVTTAEGIQPDWSFHQHGPQQQLGNYGLAFAGEVVDWAYIWRGTRWALPEAKVEVLRNYLLFGEGAVVVQGQLDISACGRQLFPNAAAGKGLTAIDLLHIMSIADPGYAAKYRTVIAKDSEHASDSMGNYNKDFYRSDYIVHRRASFYASVKMSSRRVIGEELVNSENLSGRYLADGAMFVYQTGDEYKNIFSVWDWRRLPGVTDSSVGDTLQPAGKMATDFAGSVSDGRYGAAGLDYHRDGVSARKSWFFLDHEIICLGAGIHSDGGSPLVTGVEQSLLQGDVYADDGRGARRIEDRQTHGLDNAHWVWHNHRGYYFPTPQALVFSGASQTGSWSKVYNASSAEPDSKEVFSLWIDHDASSRSTDYSYVVLPSATVQQTMKYAARPDIRILSNTAEVQAVSGNQLVMAVFFLPGTIETDIGPLTVDKPCAVMVREERGLLRVTVADPSQLSHNVRITAGGKSSLVKLPQGNAAGDSVQIVLQ